MIIHRTTTGILLSSFCLLGMSCQTKSAKSSNPNIIYILADDMGYGDISALNSDSKIQTPTLDKMVESGLHFTDAHSNSAVSTPTRYGTLTGRYAFRSDLKEGVLVGHSPSLIEPSRETVGSLLQKAGYHTACIGKWHLGLDWAKVDDTKPLFVGTEWDIRDTENVDYTGRVAGGPDQHGFDYSYILPASLDIAPYVYVENGRVTASVDSHCEGWASDEARGMWYRHGDIASDFKHEECLQHTTEKAIDYINQASGSKQPFFLYFALTAPHTPWLPSEEFRGKSGAGVYGDFVCMVDDVVKQIYTVLEETGQADNTIVVFTSDNGSHWLPSDIDEFDHKANGVFSGYKSDLWEGGHRVPYLVTWPKAIKQANKSDQLVCSTDLIATCAELVGVELPQAAGEDSFSYLNTILSTEVDEFVKRRSSMIYHSIHGDFAYREGDWVLLDCKGSGGWSLLEDEAIGLPSQQLYNLKQDITQQSNIKDNELSRAKEMTTKLKTQIEAGRTR